MAHSRLPLGRRWLLIGMGVIAAVLLITAGVVAAQAGSAPPQVVAPSSLPAVVVPTHPAAFYALHNDTSCDVPEAALAVAVIPSPVVQPTMIHVHNLMCEPTEGPEAVLPLPTAPLPDAVATTNFTPLPWPTMPPAPTPIADLRTLAAHANAVARVRLKDGNGVSGMWILYVDVLQWVSKPDRGALTHTTIWVPTDRYHSIYDNRTLPTRSPDWQDAGTEYVVFLQAQGVAPWDQQPSYNPVDDYASFFRVQDGRIADAGIARYAGYTLAAFEQAVRAALPAGLR